jgi:C-terminal region of aryl-sulfatase
VFFYYSGATPSAVRFKNWKNYYSMSKPGASGWLDPLTTYHFPALQNIKRDPFEQNVIPSDSKSLLAFGGTVAAPSSAFMYDGLGIMPVGQQLWLEQLETYKKFPPLQAPESYNLSQVMEQVKGTGHPGD